MNNYLNRLYFILISLLIISCGGAVGGGITEPPPIVIPETTNYTLKFELSIDPTSTNNYNTETLSFGLREGTEDGDNTNNPDDTNVPPKSPVEVRFGSEIYTINELTNALQFTNGSEVQVIVSVNKDYNIFIGGDVIPTIKTNITSLDLKIDHNIGIIIHVTNTVIEIKSLKVKKYGRGSLFISGTEITDSQEKILHFPKGYNAQIINKPPSEGGIIYSYELDNNFFAYPTTLDSNLIINNDRSILLRYGRANSPWDGISVEEAISENNVYQIYNAYELAWVASQANLGSNDFASKTIALSNDIDLNSREFSGIAGKRLFSGIFEGNGKTVKGLKIIPATGVNANAFIGNLANGATLQNLTVFGTVEGTNESVAGIVAIAGEGSIIKNVTNYVYVVGTKSSSSVGGIVGYGNKTHISQSANHGIVTGHVNVGGIIGRSTSAIEYCYNTTNVYGVTSTGGIVGSNDGGGVGKVYNSGDIFGTDKYTGGIVGYNNNASISIGYNIGKVEGNDYVGGMEGYRDSDPALSSVYSIGNVKAKANHIGALDGYSKVQTSGTVLNTLQNAYALQTTTVNISPMELVFDMSVGKFSNISASFKDVNSIGEIEFLDEAYWTKKTFTGNNVVNGVSVRYTITTLGEGI